MTTEYDVIIAGGGLAGASLAIALQESDCRVAVIEAVTPAMPDQPSYDDRGLALSVASQRILARLRFWDDLADCASPIRRVHVSDRQHFGFTRLQATDLHLPALGHVVIARVLGQRLIERLQSAKGIDYLSPATVRDATVDADAARVTVVKDGDTLLLRGRLLVAADGSDSRVRELLGIGVSVKDYNQTAIVSNITPGRPHADTAYERFTEDGPMAFLPLTEQRCAVVHTVATDVAGSTLALSEADYLQSLQERFGWRLGRLQKPGTRKHYPVRQVLAREQVRDRLVILGNSAHTLHPNSAQGFNLCLRDIAALAERVNAAIVAHADPGDLALLQDYLEARKTDQERVRQYTDGLAGLFYNSAPAKVLARNTTMLLLDMVPSFKRQLLERATGLYGRQPAWVREQLL